MQYKSSRILDGNIIFSLLIIPTFLDNNFPKSALCSFHESLLSIITKPRNLEDSLKSKWVLLSEIVSGKTEPELLIACSCYFLVYLKKVCYNISIHKHVEVHYSLFRVTGFL